MFHTNIGRTPHLKHSIVGVARRHFARDKSQIQQTNVDLGEFSKLNRRSSHQNPRLNVANTDTAVQIVNTLTKYHKDSVPFIEINPGPCVLTQQIIQRLPIKRLVLVEDSSKFEDFQTKFVRAQRIPIQRIQTKQGWYLWSSCNKITERCEERSWHDDVVAQMFGCFTRLHTLYRASISSVLTQRGFFQKGRIEYFAAVYSNEYLRWMAPSNNQYNKYVSSSCLFQILFECELLDKLSPNGFAPRWLPTKHDQSQLNTDPNYIYLVKITPRQNLFTMCDQATFPKLFFFIKQCLQKRTQRIIPILDAWLPNLTNRLILEQALNNQTNTQPTIFTLENLPHCLPSLNVTTETGAISPLQFLALFHALRSSPNFEKSNFHQQFKDFQKIKRDAFQRNEYKMIKPKYKKTPEL